MMVTIVGKSRDQQWHLIRQREERDRRTHCTELYCTVREDLEAAMQRDRGSETRVARPGLLMDVSCETMNFPLRTSRGLLAQVQYAGESGESVRD